MFAMHESTRRLCCRAAFLLLCVMPTSAVLLSAAIVYTYWYDIWQSRVWQEDLLPQQGVSVRIGRVNAIQHSRIIFEQVECIDPETDVSLSRVRAVEASYDHRGWM